MTPSNQDTTSTTATETPKPALPIPPMILSTTPGTWAYDTMSRRVDKEILQRTYDENIDTFNKPEFASILTEFNALRNELQSAATTTMRHLHPPTKQKGLSTEQYQQQLEEYKQWKDILTPFVDNQDTWLSTPWLVAEFYLYRRLLEATGYFDSSSVGYKYDPFVSQKRAGLYTSVTSAESVMAKIESLPKMGSQWKDGVALAVELALWGNKMDLSLWPVKVKKSEYDDQAEDEENVFAKVLEAAKENLLHDDTEQLVALCETIRAKGGGNIDIIVDNAGFELVTDLALADHLIADGVAKCVMFQLKSHPTFVSDAMEKDLLETVEYYASLEESKYPYCHRAGQRWKKYLEEGKWVCNEDNFWVQGKAMWEMYEPLRSNLTSRCDLAFVKGDANYRRLLGDCSWDFTALFQQVVGVYFPCPVCALRTLKAEVGCGIDAEQVKRASSLDDQWLVNGRFGVIHFGTGAGNSKCD